MNDGSEFFLFFAFMTFLKLFTFNPFQENTYVLYRNNKAWIIDPGCSNGNERKMVESFIKKENLTPQYILNTHCHIDHVLGNKWAKDFYDIPLLIPQGEKPVLDSLPQVAKMYGVPADTSPDPDQYIKDNEILFLDDQAWTLIAAPGHSPDSICFYSKDEKMIIAGDVLFYESIGRTDLPGGNHQLLLQNIRNRLFVLPPDTTVYPGHGPHTTIGHEIVHNPFLN